ncbi:ATP-binding protein [Teichococcus aestuarii]|uniref:ATP-binding protein n=1 Tax=Teichococcus aestuarii TaxID=568898 RepID=UPI0036144D7A
MTELIRRTVGPEVRVELRLCDGSWPVLCDPNQLEHALLNLAINARDAMPEGGRLTIATRNVHLDAAEIAYQEGAQPGDYVEIAVTDTGTGMDEATKARAFEPFFTTKPLGQGTGLGLSQIYGFVRQSYGAVHIDSAVGQGTTLRLYLPRADRQGEHSVAAVPQPAAGRRFAEPAGQGVVLLVEDEAPVRSVSAEYLRELGYRVLEATDGPSALRILYGQEAPQVALMVTDLGLPNGLNGRQVADAARQRWPDLPVLLITGYAGDALKEPLAPGMMLMTKPFELGALAAKVQEMIGKAGRGSGSGHEPPLPFPLLRPDPGGFLRAWNSATRRSVSAWVGGGSVLLTGPGGAPAPGGPLKSCSGISARKREGLAAQSRLCRTQLSHRLRRARVRPT